MDGAEIVPQRRRVQHVGKLIGARAGGVRVGILRVGHGNQVRRFRRKRDLVMQQVHRREGERDRQVLQHLLADGPLDRAELGVGIEVIHAGVDGGIDFGGRRELRVHGRLVNLEVNFAGTHGPAAKIDGALADIAAPGREEGLVAGRGVLIEPRGQLGEKLRRLLLADGAQRAEVRIRQFRGHRRIHGPPEPVASRPTIRRGVLARPQIDTGKGDQQGRVALVPVLPVNEEAAQRLSRAVVFCRGLLEGGLGLIHRGKRDIKITREDRGLSRRRRAFGVGRLVLLRGTLPALLLGGNGRIAGLPHGGHQTGNLLVRRNAVLDHRAALRRMIAQISEPSR